MSTETKAVHKKVLLHNKELDVMAYADEKGVMSGLYTGEPLPDQDQEGFEVVRKPRACEAGDVLILKEAIVFNKIKVSSGIYVVTKDTKEEEIPRLSGVGHRGYAQICSSLAEKVGTMMEHLDESQTPPKPVLRELKVGDDLPEAALLAAIEAHGANTEIPTLVGLALKDLVFGDNLYLWENGKILKRQGKAWVEKEKVFKCPDELTKARRPVPAKMRKVDPEAIQFWQRVTNNLGDSGLNTKKEALFFEKSKEMVNLKSLQKAVEGNDDLEAAVSEIVKVSKAKKVKSIAEAAKREQKAYRKALKDIVEAKRKMADIDKNRNNLKDEVEQDFNFKREEKTLNKMIKSGAIEAIGLDGKDIVAILGPVFLTARKKTFYIGRLRVRIHATCPGGCKGFSVEQISYAKGHGPYHPHYTVLNTNTVDCRQGCVAGFGKVLDDSRKEGSMAKFLTTLRIFFSTMHEENEQYITPDAQYQIGANSDWNYLTDGTDPETLWAEKDKDEEAPESVEEPAEVAQG